MAAIVLVHGTNAGGWVWKHVASRLQVAGHVVYTPTLTGLGERVHLAHPGVDPRHARHRHPQSVGVRGVGQVARDAQHRIYPANAGATVADARLVSRPPKMRGSLPLPTITLRSDDVLSGFVVFDVPAGVQPVEPIWRRSDTDSIAMLSAAG